MEEVFKFKNLIHNVENAELPSRNSVNSAKYWTKTIISLGEKNCKSLPNYYKGLKSLSIFKSKIKNWKTGEWPCRLCKTYIQ